MDSNQKQPPSPPPPPPPPPPKNGNTRGRPPLISAKLHDEGEGSAVGASDMEAVALCHGSPRASSHELSRSGRRLEDKASSNGETKMPSGSSMGQRGLPPRHSRVVARLAGLGIDAVVDDRIYACVDCSMTFGRETALCGHMRSHKRNQLSSESEDDAPTQKRRKKRKSKLRTVKLVELQTWGKKERRNGSPKPLAIQEQPDRSLVAPIQRDLNLEVNVSGFESNVSVCSGNDNSVIVIDDDDDEANPIIVVAGSSGAPGPAPEAASALAMAPAPAVAVVTPAPAPHAAASVTIEGASVAASTAAVIIPLAPAPAAAATIATAPLVATMSAFTQTAPDLAKGNNSSGQAGARYRYDDNGKADSRYNNDYGKYLASYGNVNYGNAVAGSSTGSHTYSTSTAAGGESMEGSGKVYNCRVCNKPFRTRQALGGHMTSWHKVTDKLDMQSSLPHKSGLHKCEVCNHVFQTGQELSSHMMIMHPSPGIAAAAKEKTFKATGINNIGAVVDGPSNSIGWQFPAGSNIFSLPATGPPVHQQPQGTMAMASNHVTGNFSATNTSIGWSLPATTSSILPPTPLHNQEQNPPEQISAVAPGNHGHCSINPALFSFSRRQEKNPLEEIAVVPSNAIASCSSTARPGFAAATEPSQGIGINNYFAAIHAPANTMGRHLPFFQAGRSDIQALPVSRPVDHPTQGMAMDGNPLTGHFSAAISATGWSFPATTNSVLPTIPLQNQEDGCRSINPALFSLMLSNAITSSTSTPHSGVAAATEPSQAIAEVNNNVAAIDALANTMQRLPFFQTGRSAIHAPPMSMPVHQPTQGIVAMAGNPVTGHFPAAMAADGWSFPANTSSVFPTIPLQTQEENPPQGRVVPVNGEHPSTCLFGSNTFPTLPSQNPAENPQEETVLGNNGGRTIILFGKNITEGQKEVQEPKRSRSRQRSS